jgi:hypothetical protein
MSAQISEKEQPTYNPSNLLDTLIVRMELKSDAELSRKLGLQPHIISRLRNRELPVEGSLLIRMHEVTNISVRDLRNLLGDRRNLFRSSTEQA